MGIQLGINIGGAQSVTPFDINDLFQSGEDGGRFEFWIQDIYGPELLDEPEFDAQGAWANGSNGTLTVAGGQGTLTTAAANGFAYHPVTLQAGVTYELTADVASVGAGAISFLGKLTAFGTGSTFAAMGVATSGGTVTTQVTPVGNCASLAVVGSAATTSVINSISIREVSPALYQDTAGTTPVTANSDPIARVDAVAGAGSLLQGTGAAQPLYQSGKGAFDKSDDNMTITGLTDGTYTLVQSSDKGSFSATVNVTGGSWSLTQTPGFFPDDNIVGLVLIEGTLSSSQIAGIRAHFEDNGAGVGYAGVTGVTYWWRSRSDITSFSAAGWDASAMTNLFIAWGDASIASFSAFDTSAVTNFFATWRGNNLTSFPAIDTSAASNLAEAWRNNSSLADFPAGVFDNTPCTNFSLAFTNTALTQQSIDNILVSINAAGTSGGTFDQSGGSAPSATGEAAIDALVGRGWTISVTGGYQPASGTATLTEFSRDMTVFDSDAARGANAAAVPFAGTTTAPNGADIEVQAMAVAPREFGAAATTNAAVLGLKDLTTANGCGDRATVDPSTLTGQTGVTVNSGAKTITVAVGATLRAEYVDFSGWDVTLNGSAELAYCMLGNPGDETSGFFFWDVIAGARLDAWFCSVESSGGGANAVDNVIKIRTTTTQANFPITNFHHCRFGGHKADALKPVRGVLEFCYFDSPVSGVGAHADIITVPDCHLTDGVTIRACYLNHDATSRGTGYTGFASAVNGQNNLIRMGAGSGGDASVDYGLVTVEDCVFAGDTNTSSHMFQYVAGSATTETAPLFQRNSYIALHGSGTYWYPGDPVAVQWGDNDDDTGASTPIVPPISTPSPHLTNAVIITPAAAPTVASWGGHVPLWEHVAYTAIGQASGGAVSGTLSVPRASQWLVARARVSGSTEPETEMTARFGSGHVWAIYEQSNWAKVLVGASTYTTALPTITYPNDVQIVLSDRNQTTATRALVHPDNAGTTSGNPVNPATIAMARAFSAARPGEKLAIAAHVLSGTSPIEMIDDTNTARYWSDEQILHDEITADGSSVGTVFVNGWIAWDTDATNSERLIPILTKKLDDGTPCTTGQTITSVGGNYDLDHDLTEFYDYSYTRIGYAGPHGRGVTASQTGYNELADTNYEALVSAWETALSDSANFPEFLPFQMQTIGGIRGYDNGGSTWTDEPHYSARDVDGLQRLAEIGMAVMLKTLGLETWTVPAWTDVNWVEGSHADFWIDGANITTLRNINGGTSSYVRGWTKNGAANPLTTEAQIVANAGGSGYAGVRITDATIDYSTVFEWGQGRLPGFQTYNTDYFGDYHEDLPVVDVGSKAIASLPVKGITAAALGNDLTAPAQFTSAGDPTGTYFQDPSTVGSITSLRFECVVATTLGTNQYMFDSNVNNIRLYVRTGGRLDLYVGNSLVHSGATVPNLADGVEATITATLNQNGADLDWTLSDGTNTASGTVSSKTIQTGRNITFLSQTGGASGRYAATVTSLKVWKDDLTGAGTPHKTISGNAATVNADGWKLGDDAT